MRIMLALALSSFTGCALFPKRLPEIYDAPAPGQVTLVGVVRMSPVVEGGQSLFNQEMMDNVAVYLVDDRGQNFYFLARDGKPFSVLAPRTGQLQIVRLSQYTRTVSSGMGTQFRAHYEAVACPQKLAATPLEPRDRFLYLGNLTCVHRWTETGKITREDDLDEIREFVKRRLDVDATELRVAADVP